MARWYSPNAHGFQTWIDEKKKRKHDRKVIGSSEYNSSPDNLSHSLCWTSSTFPTSSHGALQLIACRSVTNRETKYQLTFVCLPSSKFPGKARPN